MINKLWFFMLITAFLVSITTGKMSELSNSILSGAADAAELSFSMLGIMCLWTGLSKIAEKSGLNEIIAKLLRPITKILFPSLDKNSAAMKAIVMNIVANLLGMGNAATPLGLKAMGELKKISKNGNTATNEMCMFAIINTASIQLLPSTLIALRQSLGSENPGEIIFPVWITSIAVIIIAVTLAKFFSFRNRRLK